MATAKDRRAILLGVPCPECNADIGEYCVSVSGLKKGTMDSHSARYHASDYYNRFGIEVLNRRHT